MSIILLLLYSLFLGIVHGITPDEHTWPITFSYAIGTFSVKKGFFVGFLFSLAFAIQRAIASELVYLAIFSFNLFSIFNYELYIIIGIVMFFAGAYVLKLNRIFHIEFLPSSWIGKKHHHDIEKEDDEVTPIKPYMALVHGFIAGWGFGAFALILYTVIVPKMPNVYIAFLPGLLFGIGTMLVQVLFGGLFGKWIRKVNIPESEGIKLASRTAGMSLIGGGGVFILGGLFGILFPKIASLYITSPINVHNLHHLGLPFVMVMVAVVVIGFGSMYINIRRVKKKYNL
ncbi:hypothetical protein M1145_01665 [Patescibacteria group bacterium]|nr:hypothetical protein [Patescibacteria group bacterium]